MNYTAYSLPLLIVVADHCEPVRAPTVLRLFFLAFPGVIFERRAYQVSDQELSPKIAFFC